jgi:hypothetical protein
MQISLNELFKGKQTTIKDKNYLSTKDYVDPFIKKMNKYTNNFKIRAIEPNQNTYNDVGKDVTYNRVLVEAILPKESTIDNHDEVIGFLYGLDIKTPVAKIYRGYINQACTNLTVFNPEWIEVQEISEMMPLKYNIDSLLEYTSDFRNRIDKLKNTIIPRKELEGRLGSWVDYCLKSEYNNDLHVVKLSPNLPIKGYKSLVIDAESEYYVNVDEDPSLFQIYNSMTQLITDDKKDIISHFEKTIMINNMLNIN